MNANSVNNPELDQRPTLVSVLAILTIVGTAFYFGYCLLKAAVPEISMQEVELPLWMTISNCVIQLGKLAAAFLLLRMRRIGFFLYAGLETTSAILTMIGGKMTMDYMDSSYVNPSLNFDPKILVLAMLGMSIGLSIAFIGGFAAHLSKMR
jgi:hypothetical protein